MSSIIGNLRQLVTRSYLWLREDVARPLPAFPCLHFLLTALPTTCLLHGPIPVADDGSAIQDYLLSLTGDRTVPRVFIGGNCIGGGSDTQKLHQDGKLVPLLKSAGAM